MAKQPIPHPILSTARLRLRQFDPGDTEAMHRCFSDPDAMRFWNHPVHTKRIESERAVRRFIDCTPSYYRFWAVAQAETDRCIGMVNYHDGHMRAKRVTIGYIVDPARQRDGIATEAVAAMLDFCFGELGLHRAQALIHPDNAASRKLAEKLGFRCEGQLRDHLRVGGEWRDDMLYALLKTDPRGWGHNA
ncbi:MULTISPECIES: GNAT family protein [unclassified Bradyrhizobium]|uniref:GNAT family N-acetyltransferase n=1 Tax=unclassified Bradyrhizobium TaxID=2631580 RepID=UPI002916579B|nr:MULTISPECIES: GNAT family protein [unclassified Bradyrhizobium]